MTTQQRDVAQVAADSGIDVPALVERVESLLLGGPRKYDRAAVAQRSGVSPDNARRLWRALGFATVDDDDVVFTDGDVRALSRTEFLAQHGIDDEELLTAMTRMLGQTFSRLAQWQGQLMIELLGSRPELLSSEDEMVRFIEELLPVLEELQTFVWRRQLAAYFSRITSQSDAEVAVTGAAPCVVGFADMAGFTTLTRRATEAELRELLEAFESVSTEVVGSHNGRIVKALGDEVLFVADSIDDGAEIALTLLDAAASDPRLPALRIGLAAGPVLGRMGDVYGSTVNIASRLTSISRPGWILIDRVMAEALRDDKRYSLRSRRPESVRGFHHLHQWRLKRA
ncbi:MAG TPA: adenylate/guanylate cyclase domain-containing protein [Jatrophihabitantaceae bacterium]|nr:adenylate/guanylate cyclase domain-containing protein [Jatrophihabitantaceae bacterium]